METMDERIARIQKDHNVSEVTAKHVARAEQRLEETKAIKRAHGLDGAHTHHLFRYGDEYHVDGVRHQKYRCTQCGGNTFVYVEGMENLSIEENNE